MYSERVVALVKKLSVYEKFKKCPATPDVYSMYRGISSKYYPKWVGWKKLEEGKSNEEVDKDVIDFYASYFFYALKLDVIEDFDLQYLILNFAVLNGKKKAISKIEKVLGLKITGVASIRLMELVNFLKSDRITYALLLEFLEFYEFTDNMQNAKWVVRFYRTMGK